MEENRWKPKNDEIYWFFFPDGNVCMGVFTDSSDERRFKFGNCFKTKEEAEAAAEKVKALLLSLQHNELPKLTAEVFDRPDCPEWAKYAAVDADGSGYWYGELPFIGKKVWRRGETYHLAINTGILWDPTDWQNSLTERPAKLPDWCKVGEWCYCLDDDGKGKYFKVTKIKDNYIYGEDWDIDYHHIKQARLRPYNAEEMRGLVGKGIETKGGGLLEVCLITRYACYNNHSPEILLGVENHWHSASSLLMSNDHTIDGSPCGVHEHLENGKWVK